MYRGRHQIGTHIPLGVQTYSVDLVPIRPDQAPTMEIYAANGDKVKSRQVPSLDPGAVPGLFQIWQFLGADFGPGRYSVTYRWQSGSFYGMETDLFEVIPGGSGEGAVVALHEFVKPQAYFLVHSLDSGKLKRGRNPRL